MANDTDTDTEGSMIERMMRGEFDDIEISEEAPAQEAVNEDETDDADKTDNSGSEESSQDADTDDEPDNDADDTDDTDNEDTANTDSTDDENVDDLETKDQPDEDGTDNDDDTDRTTDDDDSVNSPVESDSDDKSKTKDQGDGADTDSDETNYKEEYEKLLDSSKEYKDYYDTVTSEFTANGVKVKGFKDPRKVIQAQQALYGLEDKFSSLKKYKKFHDPLEKRGMVADKNKFDLAMNIMDGDVEALKTHMQNLKLDPVDFDMDEVNYSAKSTTSSDIELGLNDVLAASNTAGVKSQVEQVLYKDWDEDSVIDLLSTEGSRNMFVDHMRPDASGNSVFSTVSQKAREMSMLDTGSGFSELNSIQKYNLALKEVEKEYAGQRDQTRGSKSPETIDETISKAKETDAKRIADVEAKAIEKYKLELEKKNKSADDARKKAASVSVKKTVKKSTPKKKADPMKLEGESFMDYWKQLERAGL